MAACKKRKDALTLIEEERLAVAVQLYPSLYDKKCKEYKNLLVRETDWGNVVEKCEFLGNGIFLSLSLSLLISFQFHICDIDGPSSC